MAVLLNNFISTNQNEIILKHNRGVELSGTSVVSWSSIETGWIFNSVSGYEPTFNIFEKSVSFDGSGQQMLSNKSMDTTVPFTLSVWIKVNITDTFYRPLSNILSIPYRGWQITKQTTYYELRLYSNGLQGTQRNNTQITSSNTTDWHHILGVYDGATFSTYIDGMVGTVYSITTTDSSEGPISFGRLSYLSLDNFDGYIDDFNMKYNYNEYLVNWTGSALKYAGGEQVFTPPLRRGTFVPLLDLKSGLHNYQNILYDDINNVFQWTDFDTNTAKQYEIGYQPTYNFTNGLTFDGVNDFMSIDYNSKFNLSNDEFTIIVKFYINSSAGLDYMSLLSKKQNNSDLGWYVFHRNQNDGNRYKVGFGYSGATNYYELLSTELAYLDEWHELLIQNDSTYFSLFLDGKYAGSVTGETINESSTDLLIGKHDNTNTRLLEGYIDEIKILPYYKYDISGLTSGEVVYIPSLRQTAVAPPDNSITFITNKFGYFTPIITTNDASIGTWQVFGVGTQTSNTPSFSLNGINRTVSLTIADFTRLTTIDFGDDYVKGTLDISLLTGLQDTIKLNGNPTLSTIIWPTITQLITTLWLYGCGFTSLDLTSLTTIRGDIRVSDNPLTSISLPVITASVTRFDIDNCSFTSLNLGNLTNLSGELRIHENSNLSSLSLPSTSNLFTLFSGYDCNFTTLNLSNLSNLSGRLLLSGNTSLSTLTMPSYSGIFTEIDLSYTNLGVVSWENFTADNSNIVIRLNDCSLIQDEVNETLVKLDTEGWTGGTLYIDGNNSGPDPVSGGYNGVSAKYSLTGKSWTIYINPDRSLINFTTNKTGSLTPVISTTSDTGNWYLNGEYYQSNTPTFSGLTGTDLNGILEIDDYSVITNLDLVAEDIINYLDVSVLTDCTRFQLHSNSGLSGVTFPINNTNIIYCYTHVCNITGTLDLSTLTGLGGDTRFYGNPNLTTVLLPESSNTFNRLWGYSCDFTELNLSGLTGLGGDIRLNSNPNLTSAILPVSSVPITQFYLHSCNLSTLELTGLTGLGGQIFLYSNSNLTNINFPISSEIISYLHLTSSNLTGLIDLSTLTGLGGIVIFNTNPNLTNVNFPITSQTISQLYGYSCNLTNTIYLTGLTNLTGDIRFYNNPNLTDIILPVSGNSFTNIWASGCNLGVLNWEVLTTGTTSNGVNVQLHDNNMTTAEVNENLAKLNDTGWLSGICYIDGTNAGIDIVSGGFNGVQAKQYLEEKGWTVYTNAEIPTLVLYTTKSGTYSPSITTGTTSTGTWFLEGYDSQTTNIPSFTGLTGGFLYSGLQISDFSYINGFNANNQNISGTLNLSLLTNLNTFDFGNNGQLNVVVYPNNIQNITLFDFSNCDLRGDVDASGFTTGIINLSGLTSLGGNINFTSNSNLIDIIFPTTSQIITNLDLSYCSFTSLYLSGLTSLGGNISVVGNTSLSGLTFPSTTQTITSFDGSYCDLGVLNWDVLSSGSTNNGISISLQNNNMTSSEVNETLYKIDNLGWTGGTLNIGGNNLPADSFSGGYDGITSYNNLIDKEWNITINTVLSFTTNKVGTFSPTITVSGTSTATWGLSGFTSQTGETASFTGLTGDSLDGSLYINAFPLITNIDIVNEDIINSLDLVKLTNVTSFNLEYNTGLTSIVNPSNSELISNYYINDTGIINLNLTPLTRLGGDVRLHNNISLTGVTFPTSSEVFTELHLENNNLTDWLYMNGLTGLGGNVILSGNTNLTGVTFPTSYHTINNLDLSDCNIVDTLYLNGLYGLSGNINLGNNANMTNVILPSSTGVTTSLNLVGCDITGGLNLSNMTGLGGNINFYLNSNLDSVTFPTSLSNISRLWGYGCNIQNDLDLSTLTFGTNADIRMYSNSITGVTFPYTTNYLSVLLLSNNNIIGTLDLTNLTLGVSNIQLVGNNNLTNVLFPTTSNWLSTCYLYACNLTGTLEMSGMTNLGNNFRVHSNPNLTDINLPITTRTFTNLWAYDCSLGVIRFDKLSGGTSNNIIVYIQDNNMTTSEVNENLYLLDQTEWLSGTCNIGGNNLGYDNGSGGFDGHTAYNNLISKGWSITANVNWILNDGIWNDYGIWVDTNTWNDG